MYIHIYSRAQKSAGLDAGAGEGPDDGLRRTCKILVYIYIYSVYIYIYI